MPDNGFYLAACGTRREKKRFKTLHNPKNAVAKKLYVITLFPLSTKVSPLRMMAPIFI